jgi:hypothetical protein
MGVTVRDPAGHAGSRFFCPAAPPRRRAEILSDIFPCLR